MIMMPTYMYTCVLSMCVHTRLNPLYCSCCVWIRCLCPPALAGRISLLAGTLPTLVKGTSFKTFVEFSLPCTLPGICPIRRFDTCVICLSDQNDYALCIVHVNRTVLESNIFKLDVSELSYNIIMIDL